MKIYMMVFRADGKIKHCRIELDGRLFAIGSAQFESLIDLVKYYEKNPLYNKVKLKIPVSQTLVDTKGAVSLSLTLTVLCSLSHAFTKDVTREIELGPFYFLFLN
jgi:hypothetical protein